MVKKLLLELQAFGEGLGEAPELCFIELTEQYIDAIRNASKIVRDHDYFIIAMHSEVGQFCTRRELELCLEEHDLCRYELTEMQLSLLTKESLEITRRIIQVYADSFRLACLPEENDGYASFHSLHIPIQALDTNEYFEAIN